MAGWLDVGLVFVGGLLGWGGSALDHWRNRRTAQTSALRAAYAEFFGRYSSLLQQVGMLSALQRLENEMRARRDIQLSELVAGVDPKHRADALQRATNIQQTPPSDELNVKVQQQFDAFLEASRLTDASLWSIRLLDSDSERLQCLTAIHEPPLSLPDGDVNDYDRDLQSRRERLHELGERIARTLAGLDRWIDSTT